MVQKKNIILSLTALLLSAAMTLSFFAVRNSGGSDGEVSGFKFTESLCELSKAAEPKPQELIDRDPSVDLDALLQVNPDTIGWITVPNTDISYPVMQSTDCDEPAFDKYLHGRGADGQYNYFGAIYADSRGRITQDNYPDNIILYGHNMYPLNEEFFSHLVRYESFDFYKQNPVIGFDTLYGKDDWKIFSIMYINVQSEDGELFDFIGDKYINFETEEDFNEYYSEITRRSLINTDIRVEYGDNILTLVTCERRFIKDARLVIYARKIRPDEEHDVDISKVSINPSPVMPEAWAKKGFGSLMN